MQPEQRQGEEPDPKQRRPLRDPANCVWNCQACIVAGRPRCGSLST
jgi:hypothetical protein